MDADGFTVVKNRRRKGRRQDANLDEYRTTKFIDPLDIDSEEILLEQIKKCTQELRPYLKRFESALERIRPNSGCSRNSFQELVCFGLGNFTRSPSSLYQFALLYHLKNDRSIAWSYPIYDPIFTRFEIQVLRRMDFTVLTENTECRYPTTAGCSLFYMPHMYCHDYFNLLESNEENLQNIILFGNDLYFYLDELNIGSPGFSEPLRQFLYRHPVVHQEIIPADLLRMSDAFFQQAFHTFKVN